MPNPLTDWMPSGEDAGRIGLAIWAASEGGPGGLINTLNNFKQEDMLRAKTTSDPDFQRAVHGFMADGKTTAQEAIDRAAKLYPGAKGYKAITAPGLQQIDLPPDVMGPPESRMMDIPQFPELSAGVKLRDTKTQWQIDATNQPGPLGEANRAKIFGGVLDADTANQFYNYQLGLAHADDREHPGTSTTTSFDSQGGAKFKSAINSDMFPPHVFVKNPETDEYEAKTPQEIMPNNQFSQMPNGGWKNEGLKPGYTAEETSRGSKRGTVEPLFGHEDGGEAAGPMSDYMRTHPGASGQDVDLEAKRLTTKGAATDKIAIEQTKRDNGIENYVKQLSAAAEEGGDNIFGAQTQYPATVAGTISAAANTGKQKFRSSSVGAQLQGNEGLAKYLSLRDASKEILGGYLGQDKRFSDSELKIIDSFLPNPQTQTASVFWKRMHELPDQLKGFMQHAGQGSSEATGSEAATPQADSSGGGVDAADRFRAFIAKGGKK